MSYDSCRSESAGLSAKKGISSIYTLTGRISLVHSLVDRPALAVLLG